MRATAVQSLGKVRQQWAGHSAALTQAVAAGGAQDDALQKREKLAKQCLRVLGSFTKMVPSFEEAKPELEALYQAILQQVPVLMRPYPAVFVRMSECALAGLDEHALDFRVYLPHFLEMFTTAMLELPFDREALGHAVQAELRHGVVRLAPVSVDARGGHGHDHTAVSLLPHDRQYVLDGVDHGAQIDVDQ